jgi:hypothetical protein
MVSISELTQLKDYYREKKEYLFHLLKNETYYCEYEKKFKHGNYMKEIKTLEKSIDNIKKEIDELKKIEAKDVPVKKVERKYTPDRVKIKKTKVKTSRSRSKSRSKSKSRSTSPTLSEKIQVIRKNFPKVKNSLQKSSKTNVKKSRSRSKSSSRK